MSLLTEHAQFSAADTFVWGKDPDTARELLAACDALDLDQSVVRTTETGFVVPSAVWDHVAANRTDSEAF